jgi:hypothetical protein
MKNLPINSLIALSSIKKSLSVFTLICLLFPLISSGLDKTFTTSDWGPFADSGATLNNGVFTFPTGAESWAGFYNSKTSLFPFTFQFGGKITFTASIPNGGSADVQFRFERLPYPNVDPAFDTIEEAVTGSSATQYTIEIPAQGTNTFSSFIFYILDRDMPVALGNVVVTEYAESPTELPGNNANYYTPSNVTNHVGDFSFGEDVNTGNSIQWIQEVEYNPYNDEIQDYVNGKVGNDDNGHLVLRIDRTGTNTYYSSRVNSSNYNGIKVGSGEKLSVEFEAQLPMAKDSNGNYVPNVPLWPALWLMGNDQLNGQWVGWPYCSEIDVMEWSPTKPPSGSASGYETQANVAYHWNGADSESGYTHWQTAQYYDDSDVHTRFHKWRVDIYRYDDGINTNKVEIFMDDAYISGSRFSESSGLYNKEFWYPTTNKNPQFFGSGDKEYFLIMNIAMGGVYPGTSNVPSSFDYAEMVVKSVTYEVSSLDRFTLDLSYDSSAISLTKTPDQVEYEYNTAVLVEATPYPGYVLDLTNTDWTSNTVIMNEDKSFNITSYPDFNDDDGDGLNNYNEAVIYNSNLNNPDSDNDMTNDYFESIAGTSLTDASDYFYMQGSMDVTGLYNIEYNTKSNREYSIIVSDDLTSWYNWKTESGDGSTHSNIFDPSLESISGLNSNSPNFFFKVSIAEEQGSGGAGGPGGPGGQ